MKLKANKIVELGDITAELITTDQEISARLLDTLIARTWESESTPPD